MGIEVRSLYIFIIAILILVILGITRNSGKRYKQAYDAGVEKGKLIKMEEFRFIYMPATSN